MERGSTIIALTISRGQVAELLGISEPTFDKRRRALEGFGFPQKLPGMKTWSRPAVVAWIASNGASSEIALPPSALEEAGDELRRQYA